jgi:plastocyanin
MRFAALALMAGLLAAGDRAPFGVEVRVFQFSPDTLHIKIGEVVRWTNRDAIEHTITGGSPQRPDASWNVVLQEGAAGTRSFGRTGTFTYFCDRHQFMRGTVHVTPKPR